MKPVFESEDLKEQLALRMRDIFFNKVYRGDRLHNVQLDEIEFQPPINFSKYEAICQQSKPLLEFQTSPIESDEEDSQIDNRIIEIIEGANSQQDDGEDITSIERLGNGKSETHPYFFLRYMANRLKQNMIIAIQQKRVKRYDRKAYRTVSNSFKYRPHNIYKNLIREVKIFLKESFDEYKQSRFEQFLAGGFSQRTINALNIYYLPVLLVDFLLQRLDLEFLIKTELADGIGLTERITRIAFILGCQIYPKKLLSFAIEGFPQSERQITDV